MAEDRRVGLAAAEEGVQRILGHQRELSASLLHVRDMLDRPTAVSVSPVLLAGLGGEGGGSTVAGRSCLLASRQVEALQRLHTRVWAAGAQQELEAWELPGVLGGVSAEEFEEAGVDVDAERLLEVEMEVGELMLQSAVQEKQEHRRAKQRAMVGGGGGVGGGGVNDGNR